jgi:hypothetical protein
MFLITIGLQPYIYNKFNTCFLLIGLIDDFMLSFLYLISVFSGGSIMNHITIWHGVACSVV